ncbi:MAG TPA: MBL fold metallo-hydrolase [Acidobacteriaceae bacterium]|jgi:glyoxylase-like metal-dependent hydrolase (beta-lactamase superfamily II)|nr:MBL fold metallo-hydrolase [Acidobacteriaceae bacterium]
MNVRSVGAFGHRLTRLGLFSAFLVRESDSFTLIDTGLAGGAHRIVRVARRLSSQQPIGRLLLTHAHGDHIGSLDSLTWALGQPEVAIGQREARLLPKKPAQDRSLDPDEPACRVKGSFPGATTAPTHLLTDGELYGSLRVVATPGHTPGHMSYFDERDGTLYAGDALVTVGGTVHVSGFGPWYFPLPALATWDRPTAVESARRLAELPIRRYCAGHGRVIEGGPQLLQAGVQRAEARLAR